MFRYSRTKCLFAASLLACQAAVFVVVVTVIGERYLSHSSTSDKSTNEKLAVNNSVRRCRFTADSRSTNRMLMSTFPNSSGVSHSSGNYRSTKQSHALNIFLMQYENYCSSQLIPLVSNATTNNVTFFLFVSLCAGRPFR